MTSTPEISVIIPVTKRFDDVGRVYAAYKRGLEATGRSFEVIYSLDGEFPKVEAELAALRARGEPIKIISFAKWYGESAALSAGFDHSSGAILLTLPPYLQVSGDEIPRLISALGSADMVVARRQPRRDSALNQLQSRAFHWLMRLFLDTPFNDLGCGVRAFHRRVIDEVKIYADQHRFMPLIAVRQGFKVIEIPVTQAREDAYPRVYSPGIYVRRLLDILSMVMLIKFLTKPLRFFGMVGIIVLLVGTVLVTTVVIERLVFGVALGDRPLLLIGSLLMVLGIQIVSVGLIGEMIIFVNSKELQEYRIDRIIGGTDRDVAERPLVKLGSAAMASEPQMRAVGSGPASAVS